MTAAIERTFSSLRVPNYRRYFTGQVISITGNWMQIVGEMWLMVKLTGSGVSVGLTAGLQFLPILLFGAWGGLLADRMSKRTLLTVTQLSMVVPALTLFVLALTGAAEPWMVLALVLVRGSVLALDNPARQSFVVEIVGKDRVLNAVALNSVVVHCSRILGPALAGIIIALVGIAPCFLVNALSFVAMFVALRTMDARALHTPKPAERRRGELRSALRYVRSTPELLIPLAMMALIGTISFNFQVLLPLLADFVWQGSASTYALLTASMGVGSVAGALAAGARGRVSGGLLVVASGLFGVFLALAALAPSLWLQVLALVPLGAASVTFAAGVNSALQIAVEPGMRGRVMALYSIVFLGSTPIGAPLVGWLAEVAGPRAGLWAGAVACFVACAGAAAAFRRADRYRRKDDGEPAGDGGPQPRRDRGRAPRTQSAGLVRLDRS
ncbi:MFS transporter [Solirubrobacter sp. CPCC 204708]|uniref:MFS transporter n=1 Tax=Solirubrobacter deserti TaxID=2282478 RepID=A0ABT4RHS3_9ACTN|nr:MFS transporter [Solirubrobacter deserti]MBE2316570.1 MFS transporter [Solirubrobacter deserti]MDA0138102.1 MFS transporter [Solirubrobacter deserti]